MMLATAVSFVVEFAPVSTGALAAMATISAGRYCSQKDEK